MIHRKRTSCRACAGSRLTPFLSLGPTPLANAFLRSRDEFSDEAFYPLDVYFCETCSLVQLLDVIDPTALFRHYIYVTGTSTTVARHNAEYASRVVDALHLTQDDLVVEIASNDGSLLKCFNHHGLRTLGVEPAVNIARLAREGGIETINEFFDAATAAEILATWGPAKAVVANNVLAHVDEPIQFLRACRTLLRDDGLLFLEVPYLGDLVEHLEYDTVYHEHLSYFSVTSLAHLCNAADLSIVRNERLAIHGGSVRVHAGLREWHGAHAPDVLAVVARERETGLTTLARYRTFAAEVETNRREILSLLETLSAQGRAVAGYGAPAKGNTLLNYCGIDTRLVAYTVDKNPWKVGLYTPGTHLPVEAPSVLLERVPDYVLILAWNFAEEIMDQQREYRGRGGRFIIPVPKPRVI